MKGMEFEFEYHKMFEELDVITERLTVIITKGKPDNIIIRGEISIDEDSNYVISEDKIIEFNATKKKITVDTSDLEDDLESKGVNVDNAKIMIIVPNNLKIKVESEMGNIRFEYLDANIIVDSEIGSVTLDTIFGSAEIESEIGSVTLKECDLQNFSCSTEVGNIDIFGTKATILKCDSEVGQIKIKGVEVSDATISSETGSIEYQLLPIKQNQSKINTEIGKVKIIIPQEINLDLQATSEVGTVSNFLKNVVSNQTENGVILKSDIINSEAGNAVIEVSTEIGAIVLVNEETMPDEENQQHENYEFNLEFDKAMNELNKVTKVLNSQALRKSIGGAFANLGSVIKNSVQNALQESDNTIKQSMKDIKADLRKQRENIKSENVRNQQESQFRRDHFNRNSGFRPEERLSDNEKSRLKILDLLEQGKITHEEAEKLLKAINR